MNPTKSPALHPQPRSRSRSVKARWQEYTGDGVTLVGRGDHFFDRPYWRISFLAGYKTIKGERYRRRIPTAPVSPRASRKTAGKVKARVMWAVTDPCFHILQGADQKLKKRGPHDTIPDYVRVAVIPLDDVPAMVERATKAMYAMTHGEQEFDADDLMELYRDRARAALASIGIPCAQRGKRGAKSKKSVAPVEFENAEQGDEG